jgi:phosphatidylglycerol:prolipoprotein diacylglycerol transferase
VDPLAAIGWPVLDRIGPVSPHGLGIAIGYLAGSWWMLREGRKRGVNEDHTGTILLWALVGAIIGARLFYVLGHLEDFESITEMAKIWEGGISLIGGIAGGVGFAYPILRRYGYRFLQVMDSAAIGLAFGIFVGRIGDLIIGDHLGKPTSFLLGWQYKGGDLPGPWSGGESTGWIAPLERGLVQQITTEGATLCRATPDGFGCAEVLQQGTAVHQTALYDFLIAGVLFLFLRWLSRRPRREGVMIMSFAVVYGAGRVLTDFFRVDKTWFGLGLTGSQLTAIGVILLCLITFIRFWRKPLPEPAIVTPGEAAIERGSDDVGEAHDTETPSRSTTEFTAPAEPQPPGSVPGSSTPPQEPTDPAAGERRD